MSEQTACTSNAVDALRIRTGAASDAALARMMGVSGQSVCRWRKRNRVPIGVAQASPSMSELRKAIALLSEDDRRILSLELMTGLLGG